MVILLVDNASEGFRGVLTQWFIEAKAGVFVGNISASVRDRIWEKVKAHPLLSGSLMIYSADTEQGFRIEMYGNPRRSVVEMEGLFFIMTNSG